jgi:hypothetical protein
MINATIEVNAAAPAWSLQDGIIRYNDRYYIPVTSPLLQDLLESIGTTSPQLLAIGLQTTTSSPTTQAFPMSILLLEEWPQRILPPATIIFFDDNGQQFLSINDVYISRQHVNGHPLISPANYNTGDLLFSQLQHFTTATPFIIATALCRRIRGQIQAGQVYSFPHPPRVMQMLHFQGTLPGTTIFAARYAPEPVDEPEPNSHYINGYFSSCNYYFQFSDHNIHTNDFNAIL